MSNPASAPARVAPHPGSKKMPRWDVGELIDAPAFRAKNWMAMVGPGLVMGASAIGGGEWLAGPRVTARYGGEMMWLAAISILCQVLYNIEISRYALYTGEPIFSGKFRIPPGPWLWVFVYLALDMGVIFPYLAGNAAGLVQAVFLGHLPDPEHVASHWWWNKITGSLLFLLAIVPLVFGGKVLNSLKIVMSAKLVLVLGFLLFLSILYSHGDTWRQILTGFFKFGNVPVQTQEDTNGNGQLDPGEDWDRDGHLDVVEKNYDKSVDTNGDGKPDDWQKDAAGKPIKFDDVDQDGIRDGDNVENIFVSFWTNRPFPNIDFSLMAMIAALAAISGNGGLTNTPISNFTRDQGWGMGHQVGAIPSMVGGQGITLSHVGAVFEVNAESMPRWKRWYRHVARDQVCVWMVACFIGVALPSMLSVEFLRRGTQTGDEWSTAALTAGGVAEHVANPRPDVLATTIGLSSLMHGEAAGRFFWGATLFIGFLVLFTSLISTIDGVIRRWVDVFWTASARLRELDKSFVRILYFRVLIVYAVLSAIGLWLNKPDSLLKISTMLYNFALGFSSAHVLVVNSWLLPKPLRPHWLIRVGLALTCIFFWLLGSLSVLKELGKI
jgi:Mn2+/Fe2+ NRAMP family transporter